MKTTILTKVDLVALIGSENSLSDRQLDDLCDKVTEQMEMGIQAVIDNIAVKFPLVMFQMRS